MSAGWGGDPTVTVRVFVGTAGPLDPPGSGVFFDVTDHAGVNYVRGGPGVTVRRGRSDEFSQFQAGTCTFTLANDNREFDPANTSSPFASILKPRRLVQVIVGRTGGDLSTARPLFTGYLEGWPQTWTKTTGSVEVVAHDFLSVLAQTTMSPAAGAFILDDPHWGRLDSGRLGGVLPQQFTGDRIESLVAMSGLSTQLLELDTGLAETIPLEPAGAVLSACQDAETAEAGFLFVDASGCLVFLDRHSRFQDDRLSTVQTSFTDIEYSGMTVDYDTTQMWNDVRFLRPALEDDDMPIEQIAVDDSSVAEFGRRTYQATIPVISDAEAQGRAEFWRDRYSIPQQRPSPVVIKLRRNVNGLFSRITGRELLDRVQLVRTPLGVGDPVTFTGLIEQLEHRITNTEWDTTIAISLIDVLADIDFLTLDNVGLGELDQNSLGY